MIKIYHAILLALLCWLATPAMAQVTCPAPDVTPVVVEQGCAEACIESCSNACVSQCEKAVAPGGECQFDASNPDKACYWCEEQTMAKCQVVCGCN